jgi:ABC-2 type transport system ATP-binding protein
MKGSLFVTFALEIEQLEKQIDGRPLLRGVDLRVPHGSIYGLLGPSGAGKTLLLQVVMGFLRADRGLVRVAGGLGYVPQLRRMQSRLTVVEHLRFLGQYGGLRGSKLNARIGDLIGLAGLQSAVDLPLHLLDRGQQQRFVLVQSLLQQPSCVLIDEPLGAEFTAQQQIFELIGQMRRHGATLLIATQQLSVIEACCDTVAVLVQGQVMAESSLAAAHGPGRTVLISVTDLPEPLAERLRALDPAVLCEGNEVALQPNTPGLQAQVLSLLIEAGVTVIALEPFGRPLEDLYRRALRGLPTTPPAATSQAAQPGRPGSGDTLLRELLKREE